MVYPRAGFPLLYLVLVVGHVAAGVFGAGLYLDWGLAWWKRFTLL